MRGAYQKWEVFLYYFLLVKADYHQTIFVKSIQVFSTLLFPPLNVTLFLVATPVHGVRLRKTFGVMVSSADQFRYCSLDTHSQNRTFRASLLRNFVLFMNGRPLRPADLSNFYASMKFVQI